jgi:hypothetical protein
VPPIPRSILARTNLAHENNLRQQSERAKVPLQEANEPGSPQRNSKNGKGGAPHGPSHYNILNGAPLLQVPRQPGTFFAGRVSAQKLDDKRNSRTPAFNIISHGVNAETSVAIPHQGRAAP